MDQHQDAPALPDRLEQIRDRIEAASVGPWELIGGGEYVKGPGICVAPDDGGGEYVKGPGICVAPDDGGVTLEDAEFIAHARQDIPWLLAEVERLATAEADKRDLIEEAIRLKNKARELNAIVQNVRAVREKYLDGTRGGRAGKILDEIGAAISPQKATKDITLTATLTGVRVGDRDFTAGATVTVPAADADRLITANLARENTNDA